jgi:hypothetical protein
MSKSYDRTTGDSSAGRQKNSAIIQKEVSQLFTKNMNDHRVIAQLREKHGDKNLVHAIFEAYKERQQYISRKAKRFKSLIMSHYSDRSLTTTELIRKAKKYQAKLGLTDDEFEMFINLVVQDDSVENQMYKLPATRMAKTLGFSQTLLATETLNVPVDEESTVQDILRMYGETKSLHSQIVLQSLGYQDCAPQAMNGQICSSKHNVFSYVHPVVVGLFLPKISLFDEHMLIANIGYIVHCKKNGTPIMTKPDVELYYDLIKDPNEHVCDNESAIKDLKNRFYLQTKLWDSVLNLRQGKYYQDNLTDFLTAIDNCKSSIYDAPDLTYVKDEGAILRRLFAAFSIRPTLVATTRLWGMMGANPYNFHVGPLAAANITKLTTVPMATLRLPMNLSGDDTTPMRLEDSLSQPQWFVENNMIIPKKQEIIHSNHVLVFYVGRRFKSINITRLSANYNFNTLPMTVAGWEQLNNSPVQVSNQIVIKKEVFLLRTVVCVETMDVGDTQSISGCSTYIRNPNAGTFPPMTTPAEADVLDGRMVLHKYQPDKAGKNTHLPNPNNKPIRVIEGADEVNTANGHMSTNGTIFVYQKVTSGANNFGF